MVAVLDWFSRYVVSWAVFLPLEVGFCVEALERVLEGAQPEIFNSDRGAQLRVSTVRAAWKRRGFRSVWTGGDGHWITSLTWPMSGGISKKPSQLDYLPKMSCSPKTGPRSL